jgi:hypothetical protein
MDSRIAHSSSARRARRLFKKLSFTADDVRKVVVQKVLVRLASDGVDAVKNFEMPDISLQEWTEPLK